MSIVPFIVCDWMNDDGFARPSRLLDQHFGLGINVDELSNSFGQRNSRYMRPWRSNTNARQDSGSTIANDKDKFQVSLDVQQFAPNDITVKTVDNSIIVEGKHEEKQDEHGYISRHFVRRYVLPNESDVNDVVSTLSTDGILTVTAPKKPLNLTSTERSIPITQTGPAKPTVSDGQQPRIVQPN